MYRFFTLRSFILLFVAAFLGPTVGYCLDMDNPSSLKDKPIEIDADSIKYDKPTKTYTVTGNAKVKQEDVTLFADTIILNMSRGSAEADGNIVVIDEDGNRLTGLHFELDLNDKTGLLSGGEIFIKKDNFYIASEFLEKTGKTTYKSKQATFTACDCAEKEIPTWSFYAGSAELDTKKHFKGRNVYFRLGKWPILYTPYAILPVKGDRKTGFLMPAPGFSNLRGVTIDNSLFWAISPTMDATFSLGIETRRGIGEAIEFRGFRTRNSYTELHFDHFREKDIDRVREFRSGVENLSRPETADEDRWRFQWQHTERLPDGIKILADVDMVSDDEYFIDFRGEGERRYIESLESTVSVTKNWDRASLVAEIRRFDNLTLASDEAVLQRMPELTFAASDRRFSNTPFFIGLNSSFVNFERKLGQEGQRLDIKPRISLPMRPGRLVEFTPSIAPRWTLYNLAEGPGDKRPERFLYEAKADLVTTFVRDYDRAGGGTLKHTIRPRASYTYIPDVDQAKMPDFDDLDAIGATNEIEYSLNMMVNGRIPDGEKTISHRYLYFDLAQTYDIKETRKKSSYGIKRRPFGDLDGEIILKPTLNTSLLAKGEYDVYHTRFNDYSVSADLKDDRGDSLNLSYRFDRSTDTRYLEGRSWLRLSDSFRLGYTQRYSLDEDRSLERKLDADFMSQCWGLRLTYSERLNENLILATFTLKGLGEIIGFEADY